MHITGFSASRNTLKIALSKGLIDKAAKSVSESMKNSEVVVISVPVGSFYSVFSEIAFSRENDSIVTDVGSTKANIIGDVKTILGGIPNWFVPGHPIAGSESSGIEFSNPDLYHNKRVVITPLNETSTEAIKVVSDFWKLQGAEVFAMSASKHDEIFASVSHLPRFLAFALLNTIAQEKNPQEFFDFSAGGFKDISRLAGSNPVLWRDIAIGNREALLLTIDQYSKNLHKIRESIFKGDSKSLIALLSRAKNTRDSFYISD